LHRRFSTKAAPVTRLAVLPFQNAGSDPGLDYLALALSDEVASTLSYKRSLSILPFSSTSKYTQPSLDLQKVGREIGAGNIVTGHFLRNAGQLQVTVEAFDVERNTLLWRDTLEAPAEDLIAMQRQIIITAREGLASVLGPSAFAADDAARPQNEEAYSLYLHSIAVPSDPAPNRKAVAMLEKAVSLDPGYAPAWYALALRYYDEADYAEGGPAMMKRSQAAAERAHALDPNFMPANFLLVMIRVESGQLATAYGEAEALLRLRPDSGYAHHLLGYVLRYAGLLDEAATECEKARSLDPHNRNWRSCNGVFQLQGDYDRALEYIHLDDPSSEYVRSGLVELLLLQGKTKEAVELTIPDRGSWWASARMLQACAAHRPQAEIVALANAVKVQDDPEASFFYSAHFAYCGQTEAALRLLKRAIEGNYCSHPAMDTFPFFDSIRSEPEFAKLRAAGMMCRQNFLAARERAQQQPR
jgi:TolB-like protein/Flp pilus assembly protein TadD